MEQNSPTTVTPPTSLKGRFPFRLGTTSFVIPADIVPNVAFLAPHVDDVEILLMESDELSPLPDGQVITALETLALKHRLTYTIHLPLDIEPGSVDEKSRRRSVGKIVRAAQAVAALAPFAYVLHLPLPGWRATNETDRRVWRKSLDWSLQDILAQGIPAERLCIETLDYPFEWIEGLIDEHGVSVCVDVGHLLLEGRDVLACLDWYWSSLKVLHLHGVADGKDHRAISHLDQGLLPVILSRFMKSHGPQRVVTLEVFDRGRWEESMKRMEQLP